MEFDIRVEHVPAKKSSFDKKKKNLDRSNITKTYPMTICVENIRVHVSS